jgi:hypothetical protein
MIAAGTFAPISSRSVATAASPSVSTPDDSPRGSRRFRPQPRPADDRARILHCVDGRSAWHAPAAQHRLHPRTGSLPRCRARAPCVTAQAATHRRARRRGATHRLRRRPSGFGIGEGRACGRARYSRHAPGVPASAWRARTMARPRPIPCDRAGVEPAELGEDLAHDATGRCRGRCRSTVDPQHRSPFARQRHGDAAPYRCSARRWT